MKLEEALRATRYFGEGVLARVWCYRGPGDWAIDVKRGADVSFTSYDKLMRALQHVLRCIKEGRAEIDLISHFSGGDREELSFYNPREAAACVGEIRKALAFVQSVSTDPDWHPVPTTIWEDIAGPASPAPDGSEK